jgi:hypothetical protein
MGSVKRISTLIGAIVIAAYIVSISGLAGLRYMPEPLILLLVLGLAIVLGLLTFEPKVLWAEFHNIFSRNKKNVTSQNKRILSQMALFSLISGIVWAIVLVLDRLGDNSANFHTDQAMSSLRMPFIAMLYGVLAAVGLWVVSGLDKPVEMERENTYDVEDRNQVILAFCVLLLTVGVLATLIVGINVVTIREGGLGSSGMPDVVQGLQLGDDLVWRPQRTENEKIISKKPSLSSLDITHHGKMDNLDLSSEQLNTPQPVSSIPAVTPDEAPLRWELTTETMAYETESLGPDIVQRTNQ